MVSYRSGRLTESPLVFARWGMARQLVFTPRAMPSPTSMTVLSNCGCSAKPPIELYHGVVVIRLRVEDVALPEGVVGDYGAA